MLRVLPTVLMVALTIYAAVDCVQSEESQVRNLPKIVWVFVILLFPIAGPVTWYLAGRPRRVTGGGRGGSSQAPRGPDDDPDFLRNL
jgi:Phospholipase_D-nuclease N-terminal